MPNQPRCYLRGLEPSDATTTIEWRRDPDAWSNLIGPRRAVSYVTEREWIERAIGEHARGEAPRFGVCDADDDALVGLLQFRSIDLLHRTCDYGTLIGAGANRGKGYGYWARMIGMDYMFGQWAMRRMQTSILATNLRMIRAAERFGLVREGTRRQAAFNDGAFVDVHLYAVLKDEFYAAHGATLVGVDGIR